MIADWSGYFRIDDDKRGFGISLDPGERTGEIERQEAAIERTSATGEARVFGLVGEERETLLALILRTFA